LDSNSAHYHSTLQELATNLQKRKKISFWEWSIWTLKALSQVQVLKPESTVGIYQYSSGLENVYIKD